MDIYLKETNGNSHSFLRVFIELGDQSFGDTAGPGLVYWMPISLQKNASLQWNSNIIIIIVITSLSSMLQNFSGGFLCGNNLAESKGNKSP